MAGQDAKLPCHARCGDFVDQRGQRPAARRHDFGLDLVGHGFLLVLACELLRLLFGLFDVSDHVEGLLGQRVQLAAGDLLEAAGNCDATKKGCDRKRWILRARATTSLSSSLSSSMPRMAMMSCRSLYFWRMACTWRATS